MYLLAEHIQYPFFMVSYAEKCPTWRSANRERIRARITYLHTALVARGISLAASRAGHLSCPVCIRFIGPHLSIVFSKREQKHHTPRETIHQMTASLLRLHCLGFPAAVDANFAGRLTGGPLAINEK